MRCTVFIMAVWMLLALPAGAQSTRPAIRGEAGVWELVNAEGCAVAVPSDWKNLDRFTPQVLIYRQSTGESPWDRDPAGAEIKSQIIVEKIRVELPLDRAVEVIVNRIVNEPNTQLDGRPTADLIKLADGAEAMAVSLEVLRGAGQRTLFIKLVTKTDEHTGFVVTGTITGSKDSRVPHADSALGKWMRAMTRSFVLSADKFDGQPVKDAFEERAKSR